MFQYIETTSLTEKFIVVYCEMWIKWCCDIVQFKSNFPLIFKVTQHYRYMYMYILFFLIYLETLCIMCNDSRFVIKLKWSDMWYKLYIDDIIDGLFSKIWNAFFPSLMDVHSLQWWHPTTLVWTRQTAGPGYILKLFVVNWMVCIIYSTAYFENHNKRPS